MTTTAKATIVSVTRKTRPGLVPSLINPAWTAGLTEGVEGIEVVVDTDDGTFRFSRLDGEDGWTADAFTPKGISCPTFANGFGARYLRTSKAGDSLASVIDAAVGEVVL